MSDSARFLGMIRSAGVYTLAVVVSRLASLVLIPVYTRLIPPADYRILEVLDTTLTLFSIIAGARFASAIAYFYTHADGPAGKRQVVSTMMIGAAVIGAAGAAVGFVAAPWIGQTLFASPDYTGQLRIVFATFGAQMLLEVAWGWIRAEDRSTLYLGLSVVHLALAVSVTLVLLLGYRTGYVALLWGSLAGAACVGVPMAVAGVLRSESRFSGRLFLSICRFAAPVGISGLAMFALNFGDRYFLLKYADPAEFGVYGFSYKVGMMVSLVQTGFNMYWSSQVYEQVKGDNGNRVLVRVFTHFAAAMTFLSFATWAGSGPAILMWVGPDYHSAVKYVPWIVLAYWIRAAADFFRSVLYLRKDTDSDALVNVVAACVCLAAYMILIPIHQVWGAVEATLAGFTVLLATAYWRARKVFPFTLEWARLGKLGVAAAILSAIHLNQPFFSQPARLAFAATLCLAFPALLYALRFLDPEETAALKSRFGQSAART